MSETSKTYRRAGGTLKCLLVGLMAFGAAAAARAADWTDANSVTYTALKSINGNGSGVIVTDFTPAGTEIVKFKYKPSSVSTPNDTVFCSRYYANNNPKAQFSGFRMSDKFRFDRSTGQSTCNTTVLSVGGEYSVVVNFGGTAQGTVTINDTAQSLSVAMVTTGYTPGSVLVLFANHTCAQNVTPTASSSFGAKATGDLYYFQLWNADGETLEHDFRPAMRDSDGAVGLYDTVVQKFWGATVGSFTFEEMNAVPTATWTGAENNGAFSDSGNWTRYDGDGNLIANAVPSLTTYITLDADVSDGWTAFNDSYAGTIDLNGHNLAVSCSGTPAFSVTNSSSGTPGELRITVPEGETFTKTANFGITGNLSLVKDGPGLFVWGGGTITRTKNWFTISAPITVKAGSTLDCPAEGPWYNGAITNETDATTNIGGDFFAIGGIFRNDGSVVHTAGKFYFGSRDDQTHPCRVENNGVFRTVGGNFYFRSENHAHGAGTFDLAGSTATLAGDFSDFTGTILLSGGTATISSINTFTGTLRLKGGTISTSLAAFTGMVVIDVAEQAEPLDVDGKGWFTLPSGKEVLVDVGERELQFGDRLLSWTTAPSNVRFKLLGEHKGVLRKDATGVVYENTKGIVIIVR